MTHDFTTFGAKYRSFCESEWWFAALLWALAVEWLIVWDFLRGENYDR